MFFLLSMDVQRQSPCANGCVWSVGSYLSEPSFYCICRWGMVGGVWHRPKSKINLFTISVPQLYKLIVSFKYLWYLWFFNHTKGTFFEMTSICSRVKPPTSKLVLSMCGNYPHFFRNSGWEPFSTHLRAFSPDESEIALQYREDPLKLRVIRNFIATDRVLVRSFSLFFTWCALEDWSVFFMSQTFSKNMFSCFK
jgi:hypothetical protein